MKSQIANHEIKADKFLVDLIDKQFMINGYPERFHDIIKDPEWFVKKSTTPEKDLEWMTWMQKEIIKRFKLPKKLAERYASLYSLSYGLTIKPMKADNIPLIDIEESKGKKRKLRKKIKK